MRLRLGCEMAFDLPAETPMIVVLNVHHSRIADLERPDHLVTAPALPIESYRDGFGNWCSRILAPPGRLTIGTDSVIRDAGTPDRRFPDAGQLLVQDLPSETIEFLLPSRYCDTDCLSDRAWSLFGGTASGWRRVQAICDFVHGHVRFGYEHARATRTASETLAEGRGVCRDYAHLAIALCRCMNIPARYCTGYISDVGEPPPYAPMDFGAWMEVYLSGGWQVFDPRNNAPRIGRVLIARGRDAADVPLTHSFGATTLVNLSVWIDEIPNGGSSPHGP